LWGGGSGACARSRAARRAEASVALPTQSDTATTHAATHGSCARHSSSAFSSARGFRLHSEQRRDSSGRRSHHKAKGRTTLGPTSGAVPSRGLRASLLFPGGLRLLSLPRPGQEPGRSSHKFTRPGSQATPRPSAWAAARGRRLASKAIDRGRGEEYGAGPSCTGVLYPRHPGTRKCTRMERCRCRRRELKRLLEEEG